MKDSNKDWISNCCNCATITNYGDGGTNYFRCSGCGEPCDGHLGKPITSEDSNKDYQKVIERKMVDIVDECFPKGECQERGKAIVMNAKMYMLFISELQSQHQKDIQCASVLLKEQEEKLNPSKSMELKVTEDWERSFEFQWNACNCEGGWDYGQCNPDKGKETCLIAHTQTKEDIKQFIRNLLNQKETKDE